MLLNNVSTFYILPTLKGLAWIVDDDKFIVLTQKTSGFETKLHYFGTSSASESDPTVVDKKPLKKTSCFW